MSRDFLVTIHETSERAADWLKVFGTLTVAVLSPFPQQVSTPRGIEPNFFLDLSTLTPEVREKLIDHLAERFDVSRQEVSDLVDAHGVPIPAADCSAAILHPPKWLY